MPAGNGFSGSHQMPKRIRSLFQACRHRYADGSGRASRLEYWVFFTAQIGIAVALFFAAIDHAPRIGGMLVAVFLLATAVPAWAVSVRRLHDTGRSGKWLWIGLLPLVGAVVLLVLLSKRGQPHANLYGDVVEQGGGFAQGGRSRGGTWSPQWRRKRPR